MRIFVCLVAGNLIGRAIWDLSASLYKRVSDLT
nr:MAG TPA: hypothetical protein [Caudoviricetes sp.]